MTSHELTEALQELNGNQNGDSGRARVLVVDDERALRLALELVLKPYFGVVAAESVDAGEELMRTEAPDLVVMDYNMPNRNGLEGLRAIRKIDGKVPVIFLTGYADENTIAKAMNEGADEFMSKPFDLQEFTLTVHRLIASRN